MKVILTLHAKEQMIERGVTRQQVIDTVKRGSKTVQTDGFLATYGYVKVAFKIKGGLYKGGLYIVKTVMIK